MTAKLESEIQSIANEILYSVTNESIDAVVTGLDLKPEDTVLAVGGSGDQAFAILEYANRVQVIDSCPTQINLVRLRTEALRTGMFELFFYGNEDLPREISRKREYFLKEGRLERIRSKLRNLSISDYLDIFHLRTRKRVSKIYLSNALDWSRNCDEKPEYLSAVIKLLSPAGLLYISNSFTSMPHDEKTYLDLFDLPGLEREIELTQKAREFEKTNTKYSWSPIVYRKVEGLK